MSPLLAEASLAAGPGGGLRMDAVELEEAARAGLRSINVESLEELEALGGIAEGLGQDVAMGIRWNPGVVAGPNPHIRTGHAGIKFGIPMAELDLALETLARYPRLRLEVTSWRWAARWSRSSGATCWPCSGRAPMAS